MLAVIIIIISLFLCSCFVSVVEVWSQVMGVWSQVVWVVSGYSNMLQAAPAGGGGAGACVSGYSLLFG